ncbi:hypothetical protein FRC12_003594 [Ceratobasidium sp. 428]|nr:hypothetical protein FRC12_003594 [Ceratobasidium sp. 428]
MQASTRWSKLPKHRKTSRTYWRAFQVPRPNDQYIVYPTILVWETPLNWQALISIHLGLGSYILSDREDIAPSNGSAQKDLNTIRVTFEWGKVGASQPQTNFWVPNENGPIHEKVAKKGHSGSTGLGGASALHRPPTVVSFEPTHDIQPLVFVFRYAPEGLSLGLWSFKRLQFRLVDWLQAQGIIPDKNPSTQKRDRDASPDIIDIDDLETDDEEITLVKHLVPANTSNKRQKVKDENETKVKLSP